MVESTSSTSEWAKGSFASLVRQVDKAQEEGKYLFLWDKQGNVPTFFKYKGQLVELTSKMLSKTLGNETNESIAEYLRSQLVVG